MGFLDGILAGGTQRVRELRETRRAWEAVAAEWPNSPLGRHDIGEFALSIVGDLIEADSAPPAPLLSVLLDATHALLCLEPLEDIEPVWSVIEGDLSEAVAFRKLIAHRRRWISEFATLYEIIRRSLLPAYRAYLNAIPSAALQALDDAAPAFEVPIVDLLDHPAEVIEILVAATFSEASTRVELFATLRHTIQRNLLQASGFPLSSTWEKHRDRVAMPTRQRTMGPSELAEAYLRDTPFAGLMELPVPFQVPEEMRFEHCHIVGGTGHGKTQLMQRMIHADLVAAQHDGRSVVVIDSQGDLIQKLTRLALFDPDTPGSLAERLVLIDPSDVEFPAALNLFNAPLDRIAAYTPVDRERVVNGVIELYETFFGDLLGAELTQKQGVVFKYLARLMLAIPGATIHTLMVVMEDGKPFKPYMATLEGSARYFFESEFFHPGFAATKKQILRRLWGVLATPAFERMFAQKANKLDLFTALNSGKIVLVNTAKDLLKTAGSQLFGRFFIALLAQAALERSTIPARERTPTFVYVDEAQEYFDDNVETILTQARKYGVAIHCAHQSLDQLSPRLRSAFHANTSLKCAGGVSAKDARALADELRTEPEFIERMRRKGGATEFAVWLKQVTPHAIRVTVPLGYLERQPVLTEEAYDAIIDQNRALYCGTLADVLTHAPVRERTAEPVPRTEQTDARSAAAVPAPPDLGPSAERTADEDATPPPHEPPPGPIPPTPRRAAADHATGSGKGGPKHRYLQTLVRELAQQQGFRATIEAPLAEGAGQVDVLLEQGDVRVAVEVSVTTPAEWERENIGKALRAGYERVVLVLAKSSKSLGRYRETILGGLAPGDRDRLSILAPEEIPDFIAGLAPLPEPTASVVRGYRVRVSQTPVSPGDAKARREALARLVARSLRD